MEFVFCTVSACPLNVDNQCRAKEISVGADGSCLTRDEEDKVEMSETPRHVEIKSCLCGSCDYWESDPNGKPGCGFRDSLSFEGQPTDDVPKRKEARTQGLPVCSIFGKMISQPGWQAIIPE